MWRAAARRHGLIFFYKCTHLPQPHCPWGFQRGGPAGAKAAAAFGRPWPASLRAAVIWCYGLRLVHRFGATRKPVFRL
jgi:hypothetical protein